MSSLRVYAISNRDIGFALVTLILGLVPVGTNLVSHHPFALPSLTSAYNRAQYNYIDSSYFVSTYSLFVECQYSQKFSDTISFRRKCLT